MTEDECRAKIANAIATDDKAWELLHDAFLWRGWSQKNYPEVPHPAEVRTASAIIDLADHLSDTDVVCLEQFS